MAQPMVNRRQLLLGAGAFGAAVALRLLPWSDAPLSGQGAVARRLPRLLGHPDSARVVGRAYLRLVPAEARPELLAKLIVEQLPEGEHTAAAVADGELRERLLDGVREDFRDGKTVELDGWLLSRTEARLCALVVLA